MASCVDEETADLTSNTANNTDSASAMENFSRKKRVGRPFSTTDLMLLKPDEEDGRRSPFVQRRAEKMEKKCKYSRPRSVSFHPDVRLFYACTTNDLAEVKALIESGMADVNAKNPAEGATPLHAAAFEGNKDCMIYLLECGARIHSRDDDGWTPLHAAVCGEDLKCVEMLLEAGCNSFTENSDGYTPFQMAIELRNEKLLSCFFKYIGDVFEQNVPETSV
ncbi:protein phosphatase 1 regulatory subunit 27 [Exaiptasia diaphana]|uniref:Uncharacterized protein n=1 Tax=Exaiptasia diaphana TaxID=2652724 RepID=A0A913WS60_EXADI|nr:protein phosphatase 1 regulatory subunit 27 [Exaiptasia diaphana]